MRVLKKYSFGGKWLDIWASHKKAVNLSEAKSLYTKVFRYFASLREIHLVQHDIYDFLDNPDMHLLFFREIVFQHSHFKD
jgi:hypothetical protein